VKLVHLTRRYGFSASHRLHSRHLTDEENKLIYDKCNNPRGHGHNYYLEVTVKGEVNSKTGMVMDLGELDSVVETHVIDNLDHKHLNYDVEEFKDKVPTAENICLVIWDILSRNIPSGKLHKIRLEETRDNYCEYSEEIIEERGKLTS